MRLQVAIAAAFLLSVASTATLVADFLVLDREPAFARFFLRFTRNRLKEKCQ